MLGIDGIHFLSPDENVCERNYVRYVLTIVPGNNRSCTKVYINEAVNKIYGILITETPEFITIYTGYELNADHVLYNLLRTL